MDASQFKDLDLPSRILLGPGPSMVPPRVLRAMATPPVGYMDPTYLAVILAAVLGVPAAAWLFGSALGLLGWARRRNMS